MTLTLVLLLFQWGIAQENKVILLEEFEYNWEANAVIPYLRMSFMYDENDSLTLGECFFWNKETKQYWKGSSASYIYANSGNLVREIRKNFDNQGNNKKTYSIDYSYFSNDCLKLVQKKTADASGDTLEMECKYYDSLHCRIDSSVLFRKYFSEELQMNEKWVYQYEGFLTTRYFFYNEDGVWTYYGRSESEEDSMGNLIRSWTNISDFAEEEQWLFEYDQQGNRVLEKYYIKFPQFNELRLCKETKTEFIYNDSNQLAKKNIHFTEYSESTGGIEFESQWEQSFGYYCDGLLRSWKSLEGDEVISETKYYYQKGVDCNEWEGNEPGLEIFPNPTDNLVYINSEVLLSADCWVRLFDSKGALINNEHLGIRIDRHEIDLGDLPSGVYLVKISWPGNEVSKKIIKY